MFIVSAPPHCLVLTGCARTGRMARRGGRVKTPEKLCLVWVVAVTFCVGLAVVVPQQLPLLSHNLGLLLFIFLEFLPLLLFLHTVSQPAARSSVLVADQTYNIYSNI